MKLTTSAAFIAAMLLPQVALACPSSAGTCGGSMGYASTFGVGIAAGILSILFERTFNKKR
jgi:hypothetical protein